MYLLSFHHHRATETLEADEKQKNPENDTEEWSVSTSTQSDVSVHVSTWPGPVRVGEVCRYSHHMFTSQCFYNISSFSGAEETPQLMDK